MRLLAQQDDTRFLVLVDEANALGRIVDLDENRAYETHGVDAIMSRGYWQKVTAPSLAQNRALLLARVEEAQGGG